MVRDNWVFRTKRYGIRAAGAGLIVCDNTVADVGNKTEAVYPTGDRKPTGSVTYENRGMHFSGRNILVENNFVRTFSHALLNADSSPQGYNSNDGEGLLMDNTGSVVDGWTVRGNDVNSYIGVYRPRNINNVSIVGNTVTNRSGTPTGNSIWVWADTTNQPFRADNIVIENNQVQGGITLIAGAGGANNRIVGNAGNGGAITLTPSRAATGVWLENNTDWTPVAPTGFVQSGLTATTVTLTWSDVSERGVDVIDYVIERTVGSVTSVLATTAADQTVVTLAGLSPNTEYRLRVYARNAAGNSARSPEIRLRTPL